MVEGAVLITGASRGIGLALAERLSRGGCEIVGIARRPADEFPGAFYPCDLLDQEATRRTLETITGAHTIRGLVNNAGLNHVQRIEDVELTKFNEVIAINLRAAIQCAQSVLPGMRNRGYGRIVNISSRGALGRPGRTSYGAAKAGIIGMTRTWALELAAEGITANVVSPGPVATEMFMRNNVKREGDLEGFTAGIPMKRMGDPDEIAAAIEFLLSRDASFVTGQVLHVCGGSSVGSGPI